MQREAVENTLKQYRYSKGRCEFLSAQIETLRREIQLGLTNIVADEAAIQAQTISDMPHGTKISNPTEEKGIKLADGWEPQYIKDMRIEIDKLTRERQDLQINVVFVNAWLQGLSEREAWIIKVWYFDEERIENIATMYKKEFGEDFSAKTLKRRRTAAFEKVCQMAK